MFQYDIGLWVLNGCWCSFDADIQSLPNLSVTVYGPIRSMHTVSHGIMVTSLGGSLPYFFLPFFKPMVGWTGIYKLTDLCFHIITVKGCCHGLVHPISARMT